MDRKATTATLLEDMALAGDVRISLVPEPLFTSGHRVCVCVGERSYSGGTLEEALDEYVFLANIDLHGLFGAYVSMHGWERVFPKGNYRKSAVVLEHRIAHSDGLYKFIAVVTDVEEPVVIEVYKSGLSKWVRIGRIKCANMFEANKEVLRATRSSVKLDKMLNSTVKDKKTEGGKQ